MFNKSTIAKILYIDRNELAFQFQQCVARALEGIPRVQLYRVSNTNEALRVLPTVRPDLLVLDDELIHELDELVKALPHAEFPIVVQTADGSPFDNRYEQVTVVQKTNSLGGLHLLLSQIAALAQRAAQHGDGVAATH